MSACVDCGGQWFCECPTVTTRVRFIRMHASRIDAACMVNAGPEAHRSEGVVMAAARAWELAKELWDAKPEDC